MPAMNDMGLTGGLAGGVGLFLLGMGLMPDGLKMAAGLLNLSQAVWVLFGANAGTTRSLLTLTARQRG